jgi:hypothetical protein
MLACSPAPVVEQLDSGAHIIRSMHTIALRKAGPLHKVQCGLCHAAPIRSGNRELLEGQIEGTDVRVRAGQVGELSAQGYGRLAIGRGYLRFK